MLQFPLKDSWCIASCGSISNNWYPGVKLKPGGRSQESGVASLNLKLEPGLRTSYSYLIIKLAPPDIWVLTLMVMRWPSSFFIQLQLSNYGIQDPKKMIDNKLVCFRETCVFTPWWGIFIRRIIDPVFVLEASSIRQVVRKQVMVDKIEIISLNEAKYILSLDLLTV